MTDKDFDEKITKGAEKLWLAESYRQTPTHKDRWIDGYHSGARAAKTLLCAFFNDELIRLKYEAECANSLGYDRINKLTAQNKRYREALEFYASALDVKENSILGEPNPKAGLSNRPLGTRAREALSEWDKKRVGG